MSAAKVEQQSTKTLSFWCCCERYRLMRAAHAASRGMSAAKVETECNKTIY